MNLYNFEQPDEQASEQPNAQPNAQADEQANEYIITILDCYFLFIINNDSRKFGKIEVEDKMAIRTVMKQLKIYDYRDNEETISKVPEEKLFDFKLKYWAVKELYFSPYRVYLGKIQRERFNLRFNKAKKYVNPKQNTYHFLNYFIKSLQQDFCKEKKDVEVTKVENQK